MKLPSGPRILATKPDSNRQAFHVTRQPVSQEQQEIINMALADVEYIRQCRQAKPNSQETSRRTPAVAGRRSAS